MKQVQKKGDEQMENEEKKRDGFFDFYGISVEEEKFFKMIYRRRQIYRSIIGVLLAVNAILIALLYLK